MSSKSATVIAVISLVVSVASVGVAVWAVLSVQDVKIANGVKNPVVVDMLAPPPEGLKLDESCPSATVDKVTTEENDTGNVMTIDFTKSEIDPERVTINVYWWSDMAYPEGDRGILVRGAMGTRISDDIPIAGTAGVPSEGKCGNWFRFSGQQGDTGRAVFDNFWPDQIYCFGVSLNDEMAFEINNGMRTIYRCERSPRI